MSVERTLGSICGSALCGSQSCLDGEYPNALHGGHPLQNDLQSSSNGVLERINSLSPFRVYPTTFLKTFWQLIPVIIQCNNVSVK